MKKILMKFFGFPDADAIRKQALTDLGKQFLNESNPAEARVGYAPINEVLKDALCTMGQQLIKGQTIQAEQMWREVHQKATDRRRAYIQKKASEN